MARQCVRKSPTSTISVSGLKWETVDCHLHLTLLAELLLSKRQFSETGSLGNNDAVQSVGQSPACYRHFYAF